MISLHQKCKLTVIAGRSYNPGLNQSVHASLVNHGKTDSIEHHWNHASTPGSKDGRNHLRYFLLCQCHSHYFGLWEVVDEFDLPKWLLVIPYCLIGYALILKLFPDLWLFDKPINIINPKDLRFLFNVMILTDKTAPAILTLLAAVVGILLLGFSIRTWIKLFTLHFIVCTLLAFLFFHYLGRGEAVIGGYQYGTSQYSLLVLLLSVLLIGLPNAILVSWSQLCRMEELRIAYGVGIAAKAILIFTAVPVLFFWVMHILTGFMSRTIFQNFWPDVGVIAAGFGLMCYMGLNFFDVFTEVLEESPLFNK